MRNKKDNFGFLASRRGLRQTAAGLVGGAMFPAEPIRSRRSVPPIDDLRIEKTA